MAKREFLHLAKDFVFGKFAVGGFLISEKIDGIRCFWDGGITTGRFCDEIPFANVEKHARYLQRKVATGLWTRYGQPIMAPDWWVASLPKVPLDGELTMGRKTWQATSSCVKNQTPDHRWAGIKYMVFDSPHLPTVFVDGRINNANFKKTFKDVMSWEPLRQGKLPPAFGSLGLYAQFSAVNHFLKNTDLGRYGQVVPQLELPMGFTAAENKIREELTRITDLGGEGLILRSPISVWKPERSANMLKVKPYLDMEGMVIGYKYGSPTDVERSVSGESTDRLVGKMGALRLRLDSGIEFDLSGFTEAERTFTEEGTRQALLYPGQYAVPGIENPNFPLGTRVTFKYRELSDTGYPKEARYFRKTQ